jgi:adenylate kinase family enzyme
MPSNKIKYIQKNSLHPFIVEFHGLPGSGKSTISDLFVKDLIRRGKVVLTESDIFKSSSFIKKLNSLLISLLSLKFLKLNLDLIRIGINTSINTRSFSNVINSLKVIKFNYILSRRVDEGGYDFICLSEGLIQLINTILDGDENFSNKTLTNIVKEITKKYNHLIIVNCNISKEIAFNRLQNRTTIPNTVNKMDYNELTKFLEIRFINFVKIKKVIKIIVETVELNTETNIYDNLIFLFDTITSYF